MKTREPKSYIDLINEFNKVHGAKFKFYGNDNSNPNFRIDDSSKLKRQHQEMLGNVNQQNLEEKNRLNDQFGRERVSFNTNINNLTNERNLHLQGKNNLQNQFNTLNSQFAPLQTQYNSLSSQLSAKEQALQQEKAQRASSRNKYQQQLTNADAKYWSQVRNVNTLEHLMHNGITKFPPNWSTTRWGKQ